ncbi:MAG: TlpA disulfide reductase family protein [Deltaproteobacteria bacterium]|nr:TlpA disulfide reductase family protein [Deltaproteobacteria bacterium]
MAQPEIVVQPRVIARFVGIGVLLTWLLIVLFGGAELSIGKPAPAATGTALDGGAFDLQEWKGQFVLVNVWATWCGPCVHELPDLVAAAKKFPAVRFVGLVSPDSPRDDVDAAVFKFGIPYPIVPVGSGLLAGWNVNSFPSNFLVAPDGTIAWAGGMLDASDLEDLLLQTTMPQSVTTSP